MSLENAVVKPIDLSELPKNNVTFFPGVKPKIKYKKSSSGYTSTGKRIAQAAQRIPPEVLPALKNYFLSGKKTRYGKRNWVMLLLGINVGLRCGDLAKLRVGDIMFEGAVKSEVTYRAQKTRTTEWFYINDELKPVLLEYVSGLKDKSDNAWLFPGERGEGLSTDGVYKIFCRAQKDLGLDFHMSTHSMRKTFGRNVYESKGMDVARELLRHRDNKSTLHYIGVTEEERRGHAMQLPTIGL